jgi:hypothetical protein
VVGWRPNIAIYRDFLSAIRISPIIRVGEVPGSNPGAPNTQTPATGGGLRVSVGPQGSIRVLCWAWRRLSTDAAWRRARAIALARVRPRCERCGSTAQLVVHHIDGNATGPRAHRLSNLQGMPRRAPSTGVVADCARYTGPAA